MVKKLIKHEVAAFSRTMLPMEIILLGVAALTRFVQFFESDMMAYSIVRTSSIVAFVIAAVVCCVMTVVVAVSRFHKNLFTGEGYLSFTLPVTPVQHIFTKLLVALMFVFITVLTVIVSGCVATLGDVLIEVCKAIVFLAQRFFNIYGGHGAGFIVEVILLAVVLFVSELLKFYACISLGQTARKNRVLAAFGIYFGYYFVCQILATVLIIILMSVEQNIDWYSIETFVEKNPNTTIHLFFISLIVFYAVMSVVYFIITRYVIKNRLNLE